MFFNQSMRTERFVVHGRVQGVGYRYFVQSVAQKLGLSGSVRNLRDGSVECTAEGSDEALETLYGELKKGPPLSRVESVFRSNAPAVQRKGFEIVS